MKRNKTNICIWLLALTAICTGICSMPVQAGLSDIIIDSTTYTDELDGSIWNNPDGDIVIEKDILVFENSSTDTTRLVTKSAVQANKEVEELVKVQTTLQFTSLPKEEVFALALGVQRIEAMQGESGNVEITFANNGGLTAAIIYYNESGEAVTLAKPVTCGNVNGKTTVEAVLTTQQKLTVTVNGKTLWTVEVPVSGEGRVGFLQTGACGVRISNTKIVSHLYESPENCDIYEEFTTDGFNANLLTSKMQGASYVCWPSGTGIETLEGNSVFRYTNAGECYIGTKYAYSNFELSFDVPYMQRENVLTEDGSISTAKSNRFGISYGGEAIDFDYAGYTDAVADVIWFNKNSTITSDRTGKTVDAASLGYPFFSADYNKGFSVKIVMKDSVVTVSMKWVDEQAYTELFQYQLSSITPTGYLHVWTNGPTNMAIDNLRIVNKDINPKLVEVDYKSSVIEGPADYEYQPMEKVYESEQHEEGFNWYLILFTVALVCVVGFATAVGISAISKQKRKGNESCEG